MKTNSLLITQLLLPFFFSLIFCGKCNCRNNQACQSRTSDLLPGVRPNKKNNRTIVKNPSSAGSSSGNKPNPTVPPSVTDPSSKSKTKGCVDLKKTLPITSNEVSSSSNTTSSSSSSSLRPVIQENKNILSKDSQNNNESNMTTSLLNKPTALPVLTSDQRTDLLGMVDALATRQAQIDALKPNIDQLIDSSGTKIPSQTARYLQGEANKLFSSSFSQDPKTAYNSVLKQCRIKPNKEGKKKSNDKGPKNLSLDSKSLEQFMATTITNLIDLQEQIENLKQKFQAVPSLQDHMENLEGIMQKLITKEEQEVDFGKTKELLASKLKSLIQ